MIQKTFLALLALSLVVTSCNNDDDVSAPAVSNLTIDINGLDALGDDYVYEGWIIVNGNALTTGRFSDVNFPKTFPVDAAQLAAAAKFVLTIEPANESGDALTAPSDQKYLAGDFSGASAAVNSSTAPAVGDFSTSTGKFFLRTPTDEDAGNNGNDQNGIWFGEPGMPPTAALNLPELPNGWKYEGWVVANGTPISTGTFSAFDVRDSGNPFSGTQNNAGPPVPGEDFFLNAPDGVTFPLDVRGQTAVISIEPDPDNSPAPFTLKPLVGTAGQETAPVTHDLSYNAASFPTGTATR